MQLDFRHGLLRLASEASMRIAVYNVENMFQRPAAMNLPTWEEGRQILDDYAELCTLTEKAAYTPADKDRMLEIMQRYPGLAANRQSRFLRLREYRKKLITKVAGKYRVAVDGRADWLGWFELVEAPIKAVAIANTARIVRDVSADVFCVVEADDRTALKRFNSDVLPGVQGRPYDHVMLIDGNDERGIDVGIMTRHDFPILSIVSHVHDRDGAGTIFSRDCAEYLVPGSGGERLLLIVNHFKSKGFGSQVSSNKKRERQAARVREIYQERRGEGFTLIAVLGDLNDVPDSAPLQPLVGNGSDLTDVMAHPKFVGDGRPGTHGNGARSAKLDYILMSPALADRVTHAGIDRRGVFGGAKGTLFPHLPEMKTKLDSASDHAALWIDVG
jgi:endonuclease/exonuclease/phosphatase family metal-dependent hydrolase